MPTGSIPLCPIATVRHSGARIPGQVGASTCSIWPGPTLRQIADFSRLQVVPLAVEVAIICSQASPPGSVLESDTLPQHVRGSLRRAVAGTLEDSQILTPGADGFAVLVGHDSGDLVEVRQVVSGPGG